MLNVVRKSKNKDFYSYALLLVCIFSLGLAGCSGLVNANGGNPGGPPATLAISSVQAATPTTTGFQVSWATNLAANSAVDYGTTANYGSSTATNGTMVTSHQVAVTGLITGTLYHFRVRSTDASNASASSPDMTFATAGDTTPPAVSITAPAANATLSGVVTVSANATDNVRVASVQFKVDNANTGAPVTAAPYNYSLSTNTLSNGNHILTAVASDAAGNTATSAEVAVRVSNTSTDTTPPTVSLTAPASGATVSGTVTISANAADNVAVASVQFKLDGGNVGTPDTAVPYTIAWDSTKSSNGTHVLTATATDTAGNTATSTIVSVTVNNPSTDTTPPTVSIATPANGATVSGTISVSANASDNVGVVSVQFQLDGANLGIPNTTSPYSASWNTTTASNASHTLTAVAKDAAGNSTTSAIVTVTVNNGTPDTTPPSVPAGLSATAISSSQINLSWTASTDNVAVTGYNVYRGGSKIGTTASTTYQDAGLAPSTSFTYTVAAYDAAGNTSAQSAGASATTQASSGGGGIPSALGWFQIPNSTLAPNCPNDSSIQATEGCSAVIADWNGGMADTKRNRLLVWGGGHKGYYGNELYSLDLNSLTMSRITNPSPVSNVTSCPETYTDGNPVSRHTYGGLTYMPSVDKMFAYGGSRSDCGFMSIWTWNFDLPTNKWQQKEPHNGAQQISAPGANADYDPNTGMVFLSDNAFLYSYNVNTNTYTQLTWVGTDYHLNGVIDPGRKLYFIIGGGQFWAVDITGPNYSTQDWSGQVSGCSALSGAGYPGLAYDSVQKLIVGWVGGNSVITFNPATKSCSTVTYPNGPAAAQGNGTNGRFRYFPALGVFALVNDWQQNAFTLRLTAGGGGGGNTGPNISGISVGSISTTGATVSWTTDVAATTQVEYGLTTAYGSLTTLNSTLTTSHSQALTGLTAGTLHHYRVRSKNSAGTETISGDAAFSTNNTIDTTPPTVSIAAPTAGQTLSGTITISANASDNVGVASVQFTVDGSNFGGALTASPYKVSWDTTSTANGQHLISAVARDAAGNTATAVAVSVTVNNVSAGGSATFQQRCAATGVLTCVSFDSTSQLNNNTGPNQNWYPANDGVYRCNIDTTVFPSDGPAGSLKCGVPASSAANTSGNYNGPLGGTFGPPGSGAANGTTFYMQVRERMDSAFVGLNTDGEGWKQFGVHGLNPDSTCQNVGIVIQNIFWRNIPQGFTNCGATGLIPGPNDSSAFLQQGDYNCQYQPSGNYNLPSCYQYVANQWVTYYMKVIVNKWDASGTGATSGSNVIEMWVANEGQPMKKFINLTNFPINFNTDAQDTFSKVILFNYDTNRTTNSSHPVANCWYSELIVSTQPIPAPNGPTPTN